MPFYQSSGDPKRDGNMASKAYTDGYICLQEAANLEEIFLKNYEDEIKQEFCECEYEIL